MRTLDILWEIMPVLALFGLGRLLGAAKVLDGQGIGALKRVVVDLSLPVLLFDAFFRLEADGRNLVLALVVFGVCALMIPVGRAASRALRLAGPHAPLMYEGFEAGMLGYALFLGMAGDETLPYFAACDLGQVLFVFSILQAQLLAISRGGEGRGGIEARALLSNFLRSPVVAGIVLGLALGFLSRATVIRDALVETRAASAFWSLVDVVKSLTTPLICLVIGAGIKLDRRGLGYALRLCLSRIALLSALAFVVGELVAVRLLGLPAIYRFAILVLFLLPPPFVIPVFMGSDDEEEGRRVATSLSLHSLASIAAIALASALFMPAAV